MAEDKTLAEKVEKEVLEDYSIYTKSVNDLIKEVKHIHGVVAQKFDLQEEIKRAVEKKHRQAEEQNDTNKKDRNSKSDQQRNEILERLGYGAFSELEKSETREEKFKVPSLRFAEIQKTQYEDIQNKIEETAKEIENTYGIRVRLVENIDIKNNPTEKFYILLEDNNGNRTTIDLLKYQENIYNFEIDEEEAIKNEVVKLKGTYTLEIMNASKLIAEYISLALGYKETFHYQYRYIGWDKIDNEVIFKYDTIYSNSVIKRDGFCGEDWAEAIKPKKFNKGENPIEKIVEWNEFFADTFNDKVVADVILCAAVSGIVRQSITYTKETNINMNVVAEKGSGKTTMQHLVLSFFGNPDSLEGSFVDTENATEQIRVERAVVPYILDERMLKVESNGDKKKATEMLLSIFREYEGKVKSRLGSQYNSSNAHAYGAIISSSVESILDIINSENTEKENKDIPRDLGQYRRFIEINAKHDELFNDAESARNAEHISKNIYGYGVKQFVSYMLEILKYKKCVEWLLNTGFSVADTLNIIDIFIKNTDLEIEGLELKMIAHFNSDVEKMSDFLSELSKCDEYNETDTEIFDIIFEACVSELVDKVKELLNEKNNTYGYIYKEMESSFQRFALLIMTGHLLNHSIGIGPEEVEFNMDIDSIADYLVLNLYNKLYDAKIFSKVRKKLIEKQQKESEETYSEDDMKRKVIELYDWCNQNKEYFYIPNQNERHKENKLIGRYRHVKGNVEILIPDEDYRKITLEIIIGNLNMDGYALLDYEYNGVELDNPSVNEKFTKALFDFGKDLIEEEEKKSQITVCGLRGYAITFKVTEIEKARKELQSQEESINETN